MYWKNDFHKIVNSKIANENLNPPIVCKLDDIHHTCTCSEDMPVRWKDVSFLTSQLECEKSAGPDGVFAETINFAHNRIVILLSLLFTLCLSHAYLSPAMIETNIVPIVKI